MSINQVASQFTGGTTLFGNSQAIQPSTKRSQMIPATSSTRSTSSSSGSSGDKSSDDGSSSYSFLGGKDGENSDSGSWSWSIRASQALIYLYSLLLSVPSSLTVENVGDTLVSCMQLY
ncbi:unnamed protein product [Peronospora farinosa]|uniref:Uncharacterized protein n=1 Tax=Peronospora farinosa TaxID=134698 RepID=A0ABN8CBF4_9STRA|nr:unnamed protein product [Peronospora farinosa]